MFNLEKKLNSQQLQAVTTTDGPLLVIAGAGSGKTRTIEFRSLYMISQKIEPSSILLLTFTRKASREMLERAASHNELCKRIEGGTFHSFAFRSLRKFGEKIGLPRSFTILDEGDSEDLIYFSADVLGLYDRPIKFPKKDTLKKIIGMSLNKGISLEEILEEYYPHFAEFTPDIEEVYKKYVSKKLNKNYLDYDDLLVYLRELLKNKEIGERFSEKYRYVMIDEYQDTNRLQGEISYLLAKEHKNIMAVGDDAQSIYGFRGANHENIMNFPKFFPESKILKLEQNYRSTQDILDLANSLLQNMENKYSKCLISVKDDAGEKPNLLIFENFRDEANWITEKILEFKENNVDLSNQAVLFRASYLSIPLQSELTKMGIPFRVYGGLKFYELAHIKDLLAFFRVTVNLKDELAWRRILGMFPKVGPKTAEKIIKKLSPAQNLKSLIDKKTIEEFKEIAGIKDLFFVLGQLISDKTSIAEKIKIVLEFYSPFFRERFDDWNMRINDFEIFEEVADTYESLDELVDNFIVEPPSNINTPGEEENKSVLTLSTIHSAKGLEWENVFLMGVAEGNLPSSMSLNRPEEVEEEARLLYVAATRAKHRLYLTMSNTQKGRSFNRYNRLSRFLDNPGVMDNIEIFACPDGEIDSPIPFSYENLFPELEE